VDWNNDGKLDILTGCYWTEGAQAGQILMMPGNGTLVFGEATAVLNRDGKPLENLRLAKDDNDQITEAICTQQHVVDYNGDGALDIVNGCFASSFYLYLNSGTNEAPALEEAVPLPVKSHSYHAAPHLVDWDGDGDLDLLSGTGGGGVLLSLNTGTRTEPAWGDVMSLVPYSSLHEQSLVESGEIRPAPSTRVWATDWNGDGLLDLLVGDSVTLNGPAEGIDVAEWKEKRAEFDRQMTDLGNRQQRLYGKVAKFEESGDPVPEDLQKELDASSREFQELYSGQEKFQKSERTGFVWLYIQKPKESETATTKPD
jgi:FG-GAP-like repeat